MNRKYLPQRELEFSVNQDLHPNFCNLNISFGSKVMAKVKFFFSKVGPRSRSNFWCEQQCLPQEIEYILTEQRNWYLKKFWAFVIGLSQISSFLSCCRYTRKLKNQKLCCHVCNITYSLKDSYRKWWGSRHVYYAFDVWKDGGVNFSFTHFLVSMFIAAI